MEIGFENAVEVVGRRVLADDVAEFTFRRPGGDPLPEWAPGAHVELELPGGLVRQYSLVGDPADPADRGAWRVAVLRERAGRGGSAYLHDHVLPGTRLVARGPRNNFPLVPSPRYLFIAGGIGVTPLVAMIARARATGASWTLYYGGRTRRSMALVNDLTRHGRPVSVLPEDEHGLLDLDAILGEPRTDTAVYCCGPEPLIAAVEARTAAWPAGALHVERFKPRQPSPAAPAAGTFHVDLARTGIALEVPTDRSVLEVVGAAGVDVLSSCEDGVCGTCQVGVLAGIPDHRDSVLSTEERRSHTTMILCVSRAVTPRLTLDL